jgi:serine/threonine protein kinase
MKWVGCLAAGLRNIHSQGVRHQDLYPQNILIHGDNVIITDIGQPRGFAADTEAADIWFLLCCFIEMVSYTMGSEPILETPDMPLVTKTYSNGSGS